MKTTTEQLKWQIHSETSITSILFWIIIWKMFGGWVGGISAFMIFGNLVTLLKSIKHLGTSYFK
jgi:hypothetical protein